MKVFTVFFVVLFLSACDTRTYHDDATDDESNEFFNLSAEYDSLRENIFEPSCVSCHNSAGAPKNVDLSSYDAIMSNNNYPPLIFPKNPEKSSLYISLANGSMPRNAPKLTKAELAAVYDWIKNGAIE